MNSTAQKVIQMDLGSQDLVDGNIPIGREFAARILAEYSFPGQRHIYPHHVKLLAGVMDKGEWLDNDQLTFCRLPSGKIYLVNGYHRMSAVATLGKPILFNVRVLPVTDMDAVKRAYVTFDTMNRKRSDGEVIHAMGVTDNFKLTKAVAAAIYRAAPLLANKFNRTYYQAEHQVRDITWRITMAEGFWHLGKSYQDAIKGADSRHKNKMLSAPVIAVALVTFKHQPEMAKRFWTAVASMASLAKNDPRLVLAKLLDSKSYQNNSKQNDIPKAAVDCAVAWNAFYENRTLTIIRDAAFRLAGTPWR